MHFSVICSGRFCSSRKRRTIRRIERGQAYVVADLKRQISELKRSTDEGKQTKAKIAKDRYLKNVTLPTVPDLQQRITDAANRLKGSELSRAEAEYEAIRSRNGKKPAWHHLFGGPRSIEQVADAVALSAAYEFLYRDWSGFVHGTEVARHRQTDVW